jgi:hypothetical protein
MIECRSILGIAHTVRRKISRSGAHAKLINLNLQTPLAMSMPAALCVRRLTLPPLDRKLL